MALALGAEIFQFWGTKCDMKRIEKVAVKWTLRPLCFGLAVGLAACVTDVSRSESRPQPENPPGKAVTISISTPDAGWRLQISQILELKSEVWVLARLERKPGMAAQMIQTVQAQLPIAPPAKPLHVFIAGKTWSWPNQEAYEFVASLSQVKQRAGDAKVLYSEPAK
jgi:hypothetical protein